MSNEDPRNRRGLASELTFVPDYKYFSVRDASAFNAPGAAETLAAATNTVVAANARELFVVCAQDLLAVHVAVHQPPNITPQAGDWSGPLQFPLSFPEGEARIGDATGQAISIALHAGPGDYLVHLYHRGRDEAQNQLAAIPAHEFGDPTAAVQNSLRLKELAGTEQYYLAIIPMAERAE